MSTRIRYFPKDGVTLQSKQSFQADGGGLLSVTLNTSELTFTLTEVNTGVDVLKGSANNLATLKKVTKKALESFGVLFETEVRVREPLTEVTGV